MMRRRNLLRIGGLLTISSTAGCGARITPPTTGTEPSPRPTPNSQSFEWPADDTPPFATIEIGTRDGVAQPDQHRPHELHIWNDLDRERSIRLQITEDEATRLDDTRSFPAAGILRIRLNEPGEYSIDIFAGDGRAGGFRVPRTIFDCNQSWTETHITPSGTLQWRTVATKIGCPPKIRQTTFLLEEQYCGNENGATVGFESTTVALRGTIAAPSPCHAAMLAATSFDSETNTLRVAIETTAPPPGTGCVKCLGSIDYQATVGFDRGSVDRVIVTHDRTEIAQSRR